MSQSWFQAQPVVILLARNRCARWEIRHIFPAQILGDEEWGDRTKPNFRRTHNPRRCSLILCYMSSLLFVSELEPLRV